MPTISVIVPVYQVERYLRQCIDSILCQTFGDFELILVNDGSTDNCPAICDQYRKKDPRIKVIHKNNRGVSAARNDGIAAACGTYITFVDSDDYVTKNYLSVLLDGIQKEDFDFACATKINKYCDCVVPDIGFDFGLDLTKTIEPIYYDKLAKFTSAWMKMFKRDLIIRQNVRFNPEIRYGEDTAFVYQYLCHCKSLKQISAAVYFYRVYDGSAAHKFQKGITECLIYRQSYFAAFINKLIFADQINDVIIEGFAYNGFRLLTRNVLYANKNDAIEEIKNGYAAFGLYIKRLSERINRKEDISYGGIPNSFHKEIACLAKTNQPSKIYAFIVCDTRKTKIVQTVKTIVKKMIGKK